MAARGVQNYSLEVTIDDQTGHVLAAYFQISKGKSAKTKVLCDGLVLADYDADGKLLGVELLGVCDRSLFDSIPLNRKAKAFVRNAAPRELMPI